MSRVAIITLSSLLLVGLVAAVTFSFVSHNWGKSYQKLTNSSKAVQAICNPTDYKDACVKSLATVKTDDPKELVKAAFAFAKAELIEVSNNSAVLKELEKDPRTAEAVKDCKELFQDAIDDFQRSFDEISKLDWNRVNSALENLKIWLSATRTYQETCLDGFENTTSDASLKMRKVLQTAMQMSSNGLAIVNDLSKLLSSLDMSTFNKRKLLSYQVNRRLISDDDNGGIMDVLLHDNKEGRRRRRLLSAIPIVGHGKGEEYPQWIDGFRRKLLEATNLADDLKARANVVVAQDGSGKFKTIEEALKEIPRDGKESFIIYIKEGVYNEYLVLYKWMTNVIMVGDGPTKTRITNNKNFADGTKTFKTATLSVLGDFFMAKDIGVENSAGAIKHQAVAFRAQSDKSIFYNCHFDGYQDTLYAHTYRQFYRDCRITGTIDFIFGDAASFFQNCTFVVRKPLDNQNCIVTAQGRMERHQPTGIIIHNSKFEADPEYYPARNKNKAYLGRPWKEYSKTIIMESQIDDLIQPEGWLPWEGTFALDTLYYAEYNNVGDGASLANRVKWHGVKTILYDRAERFMPPILFDNDDWIRASGIPYQPTLSSAAEGPMSGTDEDPNAPAGAPSSFPYESSSSGASSHGSSSSSGASFHGGSSSSSSSSSSSTSTSNRPSSSSSSGGSSPSDSSTKKSSPSSSGSFSSGTTSKGTPSSSNEITSSSSNEIGAHSSSQGSTSSSSSLSTTPSTAATDAPTPAPYASLEADLDTPSPAPTPGPNPAPFKAQYTILHIPPMISPKKPNAPTSSPTEAKKVHVGPVTIRELERVLMSNEEIEDEDEASNDDMSGNVPDGDEPSPARAELPSPSPSPSVSPSASPLSSNDGPSPSPSSEEVSDWIPPAMAPEPGPDNEADKVHPISPPPKANSGSKSKFELHVLLSGVVMWAALFM